MGKNFPRPTGELQGDDKAMPDRGTGTGINGDTHGADTSQSAINSMGSIKSATKSHAPDERPGCNNKGAC
jgi:hypothetical protein